MIMITVSIFGANEAKSRVQGAIMSFCFVLGIVALFVPLGVGAALDGGTLEELARRSIGALAAWMGGG